MFDGEQMGKGAFAAIMAMVLIATLSFSMLQPLAGATETTATCNIKSMVLEDQYRLVVTIGPWSKPVQLSNIAIIIVPPYPTSPEKSGDAQLLNLSSDKLNLSLGNDLWIYYEPVSDQGQASDGDRIIIQTTGIYGLPQGQWQMYLVQQSTSGSISGTVWTIGNEAYEDYQLPYARSSIADPLDEFWPSPGSPWTFVAIFSGEVVLLAVMVFLISRAK